MRTFQSADDIEEVLRRISALAPRDRALWGRMSAHQMVCHLCDGYRLALGEKSASPATGFVQQTFMKWFALWVPLHWPKGVPTRPEVEQGVGGTAPVEFGRDRADLISTIQRFCDFASEKASPHPFFGKMTQAEWLRWGYLHADHHLRQFGR